jgi:hypothetical protein
MRLCYNIDIGWGILGSFFFILIFYRRKIMEIMLSHPFIHQSHDLSGLVGNVRKVSTFMNRLEKQSVLYPDRYDPEKYKGDGFEFLVEVMIKLMGIHPQIGISDYKVVLGNEDFGVDGVGKGVRSQTVTVQVKYRGKTDSVLTANKDHLSNFTSYSQMKYRVEVFPKNKKEKNMVIFTTADSLHYYTKEEMYMNTVRCIGYEDLRKMLDNNLIFWEKLEELVVDSVRDYREKSAS